jgi:hypothetical protein
VNYQNVLTFEGYTRQLAAHRLPIHRAYELTEDEQFRREVILLLKTGSLNTAYFQPNIDPVDMMVRPEVLLSTPSDIRLPLRWISILHGKLRAQLAGTGGIYQAADVLRMLLAGADVVMLCSVLLRRGIDYLREIESELVRWMEHAGCTSIADFRGRFRHETPVGAGLFEREQYVRGLSGYTPQFLMEAASRGGQAG